MHRPCILQGDVGLQLLEEGPPTGRVHSHELPMLRQMLEVLSELLLCPLRHCLWLSACALCSCTGLRRLRLCSCTGLRRLLRRRHSRQRLPMKATTPLTQKGHNANIATDIYIYIYTFRQTRQKQLYIYMHVATNTNAAAGTHKHRHKHTERGYTIQALEYNCDTSQRGGTQHKTNRTEAGAEATPQAVTQTNSSKQQNRHRTHSKNT